MTVWRKSTYSDTQGNACVEVAGLPGGGIGLRDSKNPGAGHLTVSPAAFASLLTQIKHANPNP